MIENLKNAWLEFIWIFSLSSRLQIAYCITLLSPGAVLLLSLLIPMPSESDPLNLMLAPISRAFATALPYAAAAAFVYFGFATLSLYGRERYRILRRF